MGSTKLKLSSFATKQSDASRIYFARRTVMRRQTKRHSSFVTNSDRICITLQVMKLQSLYIGRLNSGHFPLSCNLWHQIEKNWHHLVDCQCPWLPGGLLKLEAIPRWLLLFSLDVDSNSRFGEDSSTSEGGEGVAGVAHKPGSLHPQLHAWRDPIYAQSCPTSGGPFSRRNPGGHEQVRSLVHYFRTI